MNPAYVELQLARALATALEHPDAEVRERGAARVERWSRVRSNLASGAVAYGARAPVKGLPPWVTLEVVTGGFATGEPLAGGALRDHEASLLERLSPEVRAGGRASLNRYFLTDEGLADLGERLRSGRFRVDVPEEGALLVVAWLVEKGDVAAALDLVEVLEPFFDRLRFFPVPAERARVAAATVHVRSAGEAVADLRRMKANPDILAQREAVSVWAPFLDRLVAHFLETCEAGWPLRREPEGWRGRGRALQAEYAALRREHTRCRKPEKPSGHFAQLLHFMGRCAEDPEGLTGREVGRMRLILDRHVSKWGRPGSEACRTRRARQREDVAAILHSRLAEVVADRLEAYPPDDGVPSPEQVTGPVEPPESAAWAIPAGTPIPDSVLRKAERCRQDAVEALVERGLITSGDVLARVLPLMTAALRASGLADPGARRVYEAVYQGFRRRRSLLLLDLQAQVRIEELPWIRALESIREDGGEVRDANRTAVRSLVLLQLTAFPHAIVPNTLLREVDALVVGSGAEIPLVEELAADIFMGRFSVKFTKSARMAADLLGDTLYARYYGIDWRVVRASDHTWRISETLLGHLGRFGRDFGVLCRERARVPAGPGFPGVAANGMIIEQQQILTTQNLAALYQGLKLGPELEARLPDMARDCLAWIVRRLTVRTADRHAALRGVKNAAYAWRQMIFYLSLAAEYERRQFMDWGSRYLAEQADSFRARFGPAWEGLVTAEAGGTPAVEPIGGGGRVFLGWSMTPHWLLEEPVS